MSEGSKTSPTEKTRILFRSDDAPPEAEAVKTLVHEHLEGHSICLDDLIDSDASITLPTPPTTSDDRPRLGPYIDLGPLGQGGMGEVRRVLDPTLNRHVAMKILHPNAMKNPHLMARFIEEVQVGAQLQHPNIIPVHELGVLDDGRLFFTMKEVKGREFSKAIHEVHEASQNGKWGVTDDGWNFTRLIEVFRQICSAMAFAHTRGVVHRDLKPANVMIGSFNEVLVVDWGIAKVMGADANRYKDIESVVTKRSEDADLRTKYGSVTGTPSFMAPEQAMGNPDDIDERSDIYALGAILYYILSGNAPYTGTSAKEVLKRLLANSPKTLQRRKSSEDFNPGKVSFFEEATQVARSGPPLPEDLIDACEKAMSRDKTKRYQTAHALGHAVQQWLDGSKKRHRAHVWVAEARETASKAWRCREDADALILEIAQAEADLAKDVLLTEKYPIWELESELTALREEHVELTAKRQRLLQRALIECPDSVEALEELLSDCVDRHRDATQNRKSALARSIASEARGYLEQLPDTSTSKGTGNAYFAGLATISLELTEGVNILLDRFEESKKRMVAQPTSSIHAERYEKRMPVGSYQLRLESPQHDPVVYPFQLNFGVDWDSREPGAIDVNKPLTLPPQGEVGGGNRYIPEGWFHAGGDPDAPNSLDEKRIWADGFVISETPITHGQYLNFINALVADHGKEEADLWIPREQSSSEDAKGEALYNWNNGGYTHPKGEAYLAHPVTNITWYCGVAYSQWLSQSTGKSWRLPLELEWEKAARGPDRRRFPWGDQFDAAFCVMMDSHVGDPEIKSVYENVFDTSVYGVKSMAGNTREWCLDLFQADAYPVEGGKPRFPGLEELRSTGFRSSRGGSYGNAQSRTRSADRDWWFPLRAYVGRGFRVARSWPETPASKKLQEDLAEAHALARKTRIARFRSYQSV
ncbi:MAG: bifunctional serine/threonine-protein kinase/formylglycine-generating enzyme family protein [Myxococcota bacterium]|nr:bifunctional serine/threonine-protein kinase/formylglycine-generating enzyme family protein [Myxococcota bacterium]